MREHHRFAASALAFALALVLGVTPALAGKPEHAGQGKAKDKGGSSHGDKKSKGGGAEWSGHGAPGGNSRDAGDIRFATSMRTDVRDWYAHEYGESCPPGLAKKNNGCLPPGQAKKRYAIGQPLPPGIVIGVVPPSLSVILGPPPAGYRYGIVDGDVVKLAIGTALVVDAISGLVN